MVPPPVHHNGNGSPVKSKLSMRVGMEFFRKSYREKSRNIGDQPKNKTEVTILWRSSEMGKTSAKICMAMFNSKLLNCQINVNFRILKWSYCNIFVAIFCGDILLHSPYIGYLIRCIYIYGRYLQCRFLKWPLIEVNIQLYGSWLVLLVSSTF